MELVPGLKITEYCAENKLSIRERLALFIRICQAVQHAHQKGVIHRDLKPSNLLVTVHDGVPVPKVIDFGIAKATNARRLTDKTLFTAFERFIGTPAYMSPEQAEMGEVDIDTRSDIYSLGVLLYELLTERTPFDAKELAASGLDAMRRTIREVEPVRPSTWLAPKGSSARSGFQNPRFRIDNDLDWIVMKCLEKDRARRYATANDLAADLNRHLHHEPVEARPPSTTYLLQKALRRYKPAFAAVAAVALALLTGTAVSVWQAARATAESVRAREAERRADASAYAANMRLAQSAWTQNSAAQVRQLLKETEGYPDRGFEWFYWQRQSHLELITLRGHLAGILAVAASRDGRWMATGCQDRTANLWIAADGKLHRTLRNHGDLVTSVAFSPDGRRMVTGSWDRTAMVWETATGRLLQTLRGHEGEVLGVAFSPDGRWIVTGAMDNTARIWEAATGREGPVLHGHSDWVWSAAFSEEGDRIVTASQHHTAGIWDASSGKVQRVFREHAGPVHSVAIARTGRRVATAGRDLATRVWDLDSGRELLPPIKGHTDAIHSVSFSPDDRRLATGSFDQTAKVWDTATGVELFTVRGHGSPVSSVAFSADGKRLITAGGYLTITPTGRSMTPGGGDGTAKVWPISQDHETLTLRGHTNKIMAVAFSPDGHRILTGSLDKTARTWDTESGHGLLTLDHDTEVRAVAYAPDGQWIVTGSNDASAAIWDAATGTKLRELTGHEWGVNGVAVTSNSRRVITVSGDATARIWDAKSGKHLLSLPRQIVEFYGVAVSPDGRRVVTVGKERTPRVWDTSDGRQLLTLEGHSDEIWSAAFSPDGRRIVTGSWDGTARLWQAASADQVSRWLAQEQAENQRTGEAAERDAASIGVTRER